MDNNISGNITNNKEIFKHTLISLSLNQIGTSKFQSIFEKYDLDHDGKLNTTNSQGGVNELELFQKDYEKIIAEGNNNNNARLIKEFYTNIINFIQNGNKNGVYKDGIELHSNGKIDEETHQSETLGNCWFLSRINALSDTDFGSEAIKNAISKDSEGNYIVKLKEPEEEFIVTAFELQEAVDSEKYSDGDLDMLILELGFEKAIDKAVDELDQKDIAAGEKFTKSSLEISKYMKEHDGKIPEILEGGENPIRDVVGERANIIKRLTGLEEYEINIENPRVEEILIDKSKNPKNIGVTFACNYDIAKKEKWEDNDGHEYSIKKVTTDKNGKISKITVINPWNNKEDINITFEEFKTMCDRGFEVFTKNKTLDNKYSKFNSEFEVEKFVKAVQNPQAKDPLDFVELPDKVEYKKQAIAKVGGYKTFMNSLMDITQKYIEIEDRIYKEKGIDGLLEFHGHKIEDITDEKRKIYADAMKDSLEERIAAHKKLMINLYSTELGFTQDEIKEIKENPEKAERICKKYGYKY